MPTAIIRLNTPGPSMATITNANRIVGKTSKISTTDMRNLSTAPPKKPALRPITIPIVAPMPTATTPTVSEIRDPQMMRLRMSRPKASVPNQCKSPGGFKRKRMLWTKGSKGESHGLKTAANTNKRMMMQPTSIARLLTIRCTIDDVSRSGDPFIFDSRINEFVDEIGQQIHQQEAKGEEHDRALKLGIVT